MGALVSTGAILFTDMVGSTELRSRLGDALAERLRKDHDELVAEAVAAHGGIVLRWTGDGIKAAFQNASDAVGAAVDIQRAVVEYGLAAEAVASFSVRIGIAAGEVLIDDGDHHGVPVIEAARLEALARPGEILATDVVRLLGQRRANVAFEVLGERTLKGLEHPVVVHRVVDLTTAAIPMLPKSLVSDGGLPMVGRDTQLARFRSAWSAARGGRVGLLLVRAPAGFGASRFLGACGEMAHLDGAIVMAGACTSELGPPYEPFVAAFREISGLDRSLELGIAEQSGPLARLFPGSTSSHADAQPATARFEVFDAVVALLRRLSRLQPVALVIDDLHLASAPTLLLLRHLVTELVDERLMIMAAYREDELGSGHPLRDLLAAVRSAPGVAQVELGPLTDADVVSLTAAACPSLSANQTAELAQRVHRDSGGTPLFASALLEHLVAAGLIDDMAHVDHLPIPESVQDVVAQRLARLSDGTREVLTFAAVIGTTFDIELLAEVVRLPPDDVLDLVDDAVRAGFVTELGVDQFSFAHAIVRTALADGLGATRRARAHRRIAEALEVRGEVRGEDQVDELALHWRLAGDDARATTHLARAARRDMVAVAYESARARYQEVVDLLARDAQADVVTRAEAWLGLGAAGRALGDQSYTQAVSRAARLARTARSAALMAEAAALSTWPGTFFFIAELPDTELIELCEDALTLLSDDDPMRVRVLATLASHLTFGAERERRVELIREATELAARHHDPALTAVVLNAEYLCLWEPATLDRREQIGRELGRIGRATGDPEMTFLSGFFSAYCTAERGDLTGARERLSELGGVAAATRNQYFEFLTDRLVLSIDIVRCEPGTAARVDALLERHAATYADTDGTWALQTGALAYQAGTLGTMVNSLQAMTAGPQARTWTAALALALLWNGDVAGATAALDERTNPPKNYFWMAVTQVHGEVSAGLGLADRCAALFDALLPFRGRIGIVASGSLCYALVSRSLGELALALGRHDEGIELLEESAAHADRVGMRFESVVSRRLLATAHVTAGRPAQAATTIDEAYDIALQYGFARELTLIDELRVAASTAP